MKVWATTERNLPDRNFTIVVLIFGTLALAGQKQRHLECVLLWAVLLLVSIIRELG